MTGKDYVARWLDPVRASGRRVTAVLGYCASSSFAGTIAEGVAGWQDDAPQVLLFDPSPANAWTILQFGYFKVLEALARGKAVVTTSRGAEGYMEFEPEPPLVIADEPGAIAAATADLLADTARRRQLGARASEFAHRHYSPSAWATRLEAVYEEARQLG